MRRTLTALPLIAALSTPTSGQAHQIDFCDIYADTARSVMQARQGGVAQRDLIRVTHEGTNPRDAGSVILRDTTLQLIATAYQTPIAQGSRAQRDAVEVFEFAAMYVCSVETGG